MGRTGRVAWQDECNIQIKLNLTQVRDVMGHLNPVCFGKSHLKGWFYFDQDDSMEGFIVDDDELFKSVVPRVLRAQSSSPALLQKQVEL